MPVFQFVLSMIMIRKIEIVLTMCMVCAVSVLAQATRLPYFCGFEEDDDMAGWAFHAIPTSPSEWAHGGAISRTGAKSLYISSDGGATAGYERINSGYSTVAYRMFTLAAGDYTVSFDLKVRGDESAEGVPRDAVAVVWMPASVGNPTGGSGSNFPLYVSGYPFKTTTGGNIFCNKSWTNVSGVQSVPEDGDYYLAFVWKANGDDAVFDPGACVDNIQIERYDPTACAGAPTDMKADEDAATGDIVVSWNGNADLYEVKYFRTNVDGGVKEVDAGDVQTESYRIDVTAVPEGIYTVGVRSVCGADTSIWSFASDILVFDASKHCLNYIDLYGDDVVCTSGSFNDPERDTGVRDYGPLSQQSMHTVHTDPEEYDPYTGFGLKTVPEGSVASVRLCNRTPTAGTITYTYTVPGDADILKLRYAAVLQYQHLHPEEIQTQIKVELLNDRDGGLLNQCTYSNFNAISVQSDTVRKWHEFIPTKELGVDPMYPIWWSEWLTMGLDLRGYIGQTIKIRITMLPCGANVHFAYGYFVLDCGKAEISGISCGDHPNSFTVPDGFVYEWYRTREAADPDREIVCRNDTMVVAADDTTHYTVDLINPENANCRFSLTASALPRRPVADMDYETDGTACHNVVKFINRSEILGFWDTDGDGDLDTIPQNETCPFVEWDFGPYGTSTALSPEITLPAEGDTFTVVLRAMSDEYGSCADEKPFTVEIPAIIPAPTDVYYNVCQGEKVVHDGHEYTEEGDYPIRYPLDNGCDSLVTVHVSTIVPLTHDSTAVICTGDKFEFYGKEYDTTGDYTDTLRSTSGGGCDSVYRVLHLTVNTSLLVDIDTVVEVCADYGTFAIQYEIAEGTAHQYQVQYDAAAHAAGFYDTDTLPVPDGGKMEFSLPAAARPGTYTARIIFYNDDCGNSETGIRIEVYYPSSIVTQRWNDVLAVLNKDHNGGYTLTQYQWYMDDAPVAGADRSIYYARDGLRIGSRYKVSLTRSDDGVRQFSCDVQPQTLTRPSDDIPTVVFAGDALNVPSVSRAKAYLYTIGGILHSVSELEAGTNTIVTPGQPGVYLLRITSADYTSTVMKILVQ